MLNVSYIPFIPSHYKSAVQRAEYNSFMLITSGKSALNAHIVKPPALSPSSTDWSESADPSADSVDSEIA